MSIDWSNWILEKNIKAKEEELKKSDFSDLEKGDKLGKIIMMKPHSDTHMKVTHEGKTHILPDNEAESYAKKHLGDKYSPTKESPTMVSHARDTGMSHSSDVLGSSRKPNLP